MRDFDLCSMVGIKTKRFYFIQILLDFSLALRSKFQLEIEQIVKLVVVIHNEDGAKLVVTLDSHFFCNFTILIFVLDSLNVIMEIQHHIIPLPETQLHRNLHYQTFTLRFSSFFNSSQQIQPQLILIISFQYCSRNSWVHYQSILSQSCLAYIILSSSRLLVQALCNFLIEAKMSNLSQSQSIQSSMLNYFFQCCFGVGAAGCLGCLLRTLENRFLLQVKGSSALLYICLNNMFIIDSELTSNTQIIMALPQIILYKLQLPEFINNFKQACVSRFLPPIDYGIEFLKTTNSPILIVLLIVLFVELIRIAIVQVRNSKKIQTVTEQPDNRSAAREIKDIKRQLKAIQKTVQQLKQSGVSRSTISGRQSVISNQSTKEIINSCKESWIKREEIALHIVEYQTLLMKEVRQLKRSATSRASSPLKSINTIPLSTKSNSKNVKASASLPVLKNQKKNQTSQVKTPEFVESVQPKVPISRAPKLELTTKRKEPEAPKTIIEERKQTVQQIIIVKHQTIRQTVGPAAQIIQPTTLQHQPQIEQINHVNSVPNQQVYIKQQPTIPSQIQQDFQIEQPPIVVEETPRPMPPLPKQAPAVGRRPPIPPQKGQRKNPPPPPVRKM